MRFAVAQFDIAWEDKAANHAIIEPMLDEAVADGRITAGDFVLLPELGDTGFSFNLDTIIDERTLPWASKLAKRLGIWLQPGYAERGDDGKGRNCAAIISPDGAVLGVYRKVHPFSYSREIEHFTGGHELLIRRCGEAMVCPLICYDLRFPELFRHAAVAGAEVFTIGASWPSTRQHHWRAMHIARAIENQACIVAVNRIGRDPSLEYSGGSLIVSPMGEVLAEAGDEPTVIVAECDLCELRTWREKFPALKDVRRELLGRIEIDV
jgi:omega-amidase